MANQEMSLQARDLTRVYRRGSEQIRALELNRSTGLTVVMVTHNQGLARLPSRTIEMRDGRAES